MKSISPEKTWLVGTRVVLSLASLLVIRINYIGFVLGVFLFLQVVLIGMITTLGMDGWMDENLLLQ